MSFVSDCLQGKASAEDVDDYVEAWNEEGSSEPLSTYLGMTPGEYSRWVADASALSAILEAHKTAQT